MPWARLLVALGTSAVVLLTSPPSANARDIADPRRPVSVGGGIGIGNFTSDLGAETDVGVAWGVRLGWTPFTKLGGEVSVLSVNGSIASRIAGSGTPVDRQNLRLLQFAASARAFWPYGVGASSTLEPYAHAGVGYGRLSSSDPTAAQGIPTQNTVAIPLGAGLSWHITEALTVDGRFTWSLLPNVDVPLIGDSGAWSVMVSVGARMGR